MLKLPFWFPNKKNLIWYIVFIAFFLLSLDFWNWGKARPLIFGLPFWVIYLFILTLTLSSVFYAFTKFYWEENK